MKTNEFAVSAVIGVILMVAITVAIAAAVYYYVLPMTQSNANVPPVITWDVDQLNNRITILEADGGFSYASTNGGTTTGNLVFKTSTTTYSIGANFKLSTILQPSVPSDWATGAIRAGDMITEFTDQQTYDVIWVPTDTSIGTIIFN